MDQRTKRTAAQALLTNPFDRFELGPGVFGWVYEFTNEWHLPIPELTTATYEVAVQLEGSWAVRVWGREAAWFAAGDVFAIPAGVRHGYEFRAAPGRAGRQVGFAVDVDAFDLGSAAPAFSRTRLEGQIARRLRELAHATLDFRRGRSTDGAEALRAELLSLVLARTDGPSDSVVDAARRELRRTLACPLYLEHIAEAVGLHPKTLSRRFIESTGVSPIRFRTELRLQKAIRLLWSRPRMPIRFVASEVGIDDVRFFHRLVRSTFGLTPGQLGRREQARRRGSLVRGFT